MDCIEARNSGIGSRACSQQCDYCKNLYSKEDKKE